MADQVDIANSALVSLGARTITSLADNVNQARILSAIWDSERDSELRKHIWKFTITRTTLPALASVPASGPYNQQFQLPGDCLRVLQVGDNYPGADLSDYRSGATTDDYAIEGGMVLSNLSAPLSLRYVRQITDTTAWDACFCAAFSARLAQQSCFAITQSTAKEKGAMAAYAQAIRDAIRANALETPPTVQADDTWISTRPVGSGGAPTIRYG